jgi:Methyltransferase domain
VEIKSDPTSVCRCCASKASQVFSGLLLEFNINYFECSVCGYVQTEYPYWLDKAYSSAINNCDTGIMLRNQANVGIVLATLNALRQMKGRVVDCAGGYGILIRLLRDRGVNALWSDPYCKNLLAVGFEHTDEKAELVTAFEAFEHFVNPVLEVEKLFEIAPNLLISTTLIATPAPAPHGWWYYGLDHGQHVGFFRVQTLQFIAKKFGKQLVSDGVGCHLFADKPISSTQWNLNVRIARRFPFLYGRKLESKVWSDFEKMSRKQ